MNLGRARFLAVRAHQRQLQSTGEPLLAHVRRVAATTPEFARPVAWLHEVLEWTSVTEEQLLADGVTDDELRALRLLTRTVGRGCEAGYLAHIGMIARASGPAGVLARAVKVADLSDRLRHAARLKGTRLPYERALELVLAGVAAQRPRLSSGAWQPAA